MESPNTIDKKLYSSSFNGDLEGVVAALGQGGRVTMRSTEGFTPLLVAAQKGHTDICGLLLAHGSDVNEVEMETKSKDQLTALHFAAVQGHEAVVEALLSWGATVDPQTHGGGTPLYGACQKGQEGLCSYTLEGRVQRLYAEQRWCSADS